MGVTWAYALLRFIEVPSPMQGFWLGCWLALAMATRPNLGVLLFVTAVAMLRAKKWRSIVVAACLPLVVVGAALASYNVARFHKPFELGHSYQMTFMDMRTAHTCRLRNFAEVLRLFNSAIHYVFWPMNIHSHFPFVDVQLTRLDPALSWNGGADTIIGAGVLIPLTLIGTAAAILLALRREPLENGTRGALFVMGGAWLTLFGLCACWWIVTRYALDFMLLMSIATVICVERGLEVLSQSGLRLLPLRVLVALLASWSIVLGILLGFLGPNHEFEHANPTLFQEFAQIFNPKAPR